MIISILGLAGLPIFFILLYSGFKFMCEKGFSGTAACLLLYITILFCSFLLSTIENKDSFMVNIFFVTMKIISILNTILLAICFIYEYIKKV